MKDKLVEEKGIDQRTLMLIQMAQKGDTIAHNTLVQENIGLVWSIVKRFKGRDAETEDLFQVGCIGLVKSIKKFDPGFQVRFSTYAVPMIMGEIKRFLRDDGLIRVSRSLKELGQKAYILKDIIEKESGRNPAISELAEKLDVEPEELTQALEAGYQHESLYKTIGDNEQNPVYLIDRIKTDENESVIIDRLSLKEAMSRLDKKSREIIFLRYFKEETQQFVADKMGISQVQVSRLEKKIIEELRNRFM